MGLGLLPKPPGYFHKPASGLLGVVQPAYGGFTAVLGEEAEAVAGLDGAEQGWRAGNGPAVAHPAGLGCRERYPGPAGQGVANGADLLRQGFGMRLQRLEADRFGQAEGVAVLPDQFGQHRAALQSRPQAVGEGPNVGAGAARDPERNGRKIHRDGFHPGNFSNFVRFGKNPNLLVLLTF